MLVALREQMREAIAAQTPLRIIGGDTKSAWWHTRATTSLCLAELQGIVAYEPTELVITAYAGTPLHDIQAALAARKQMLGFEPPETGSRSTLGGVVASGLAGPSRLYRGAVRDYVLGVKLLSSDGEPLRFGGQVMKNVAGYDISRLVTGAWGRLGPLTEVSLRVLPAPDAIVSMAWQCGLENAHRRMLDLGRRALPVTGMSFDGTMLRLRMEGAARALAEARTQLPGNAIDEDPALWRGWRDLTHPFFSSARSLWRISVPPASQIPQFNESFLWDWGGALRWVDVNLPAADIIALAAAAGGFARPWRHTAADTELVPPLAALDLRIRRVFDETGIFNPD